MILNGNSFGYGAFQIDTRPLYITFTYDTATSKFVPDVDYTAQQIVEMLNTRQVIAKVLDPGQTTIFAPITEVYYLNGWVVKFGVISFNNPNDISQHWYVKVVRNDSGWEVIVDDQN